MTSHNGLTTTTKPKQQPEPLTHNLKYYLTGLLIKFSATKILKITSTGNTLCKQNLGNL